MKEINDKVFILEQCLQKGELLTRRQVVALFYQSYTPDTDRKARFVISELAKDVPIIANSFGKGYRLAKNSQDVEGVRSTIKDLQSRIEELQKRLIPLQEFNNRW